MKKVLKNIFKIILIISIFILLSGLYLYHYSFKPHANFLLNISGLRDPARFIKNETIIHVKNRKVPIIIYKHKEIKTDKSYILFHAFSPLAHKHDKINLMASSICGSTGMNVFIPKIESYMKRKLNYNDAFKEIRETYTAIVKQYPGKYRVFSACLGANAILVALRDVPGNIYPEKFFLYGPFIDGKRLIKFYNSDKKFDADLMVKMALSSRMDQYSEEEKLLIHKAIMASKPGVTDKNEMKKILGNKLFLELSVTKLDDKDSELFNATAALKGKHKIPSSCQFFIMHSKNDNIVPFAEGKKLSQYLQRQGKDVKFFGTEIYSHSENQVTVTGLLHETKYLLNFFEELFDGDVN